MNIKLEDIRSQRPCADGWKMLVQSLDGRTKGDVSLSHILNTNGIDDAIWCLRVLPYKEQCLFRADVAELVIHLSNDPRPQYAIKTLRKWCAGDTDDQSLVTAAKAAYDYAEAAYNEGAANYTDTYADAFAAYHAASAAYHAASAAYAANTTTLTAAYTAVDTGRPNIWLVITRLFKKHYCEEMK